GTVDWAIFDDAVVLQASTVDYLYSDFTPFEQPYVRGSRAYLERIVDAVTAGITGERDKALALLDWCRDIPFTYTRGAWLAGGQSAGDVFHGGAEEEVIRKGSGMCNEQARVLGILAQIAGLPSRY